MILMGGNVNRYDPLWGAMSIVMTHSGGAMLMVMTTLGRNVNRYDPLWGAMSIVMTYSGRTIMIVIYA